MAAKIGTMDQYLGIYNPLTGRASAAQNATTLLAAIADAASANKMIYLTPGTWTLNAPVTVPATRGLFVPKSATINKNGFALIVQGPLWVSHDDVSWHTGAGSFKWTLRRFTQSGGKNVKEYGAKVDGVTDDTAALNTCLAENAHVLVPEGVLLHSGTIIMNIGNRLSGVHAGVDAATAGDAGVHPYTSGSSLHYTGAGVAVEGSFAALVDGQIRIDNLLIYSGGGTTGIHIKNVVDVWFDHVNVHGQTFPTTTQGFSLAAIHCEQSLTGSDFVGIVRVNDCMLRYTTGYGLKVDGGNNLNAFTIIGNRIQGNSLGGISVGGHALSWDIGGNDIEGNGGYQIYSYYSGGWNIHGNHSEPPVGNTNPMYFFERGTAIAIVGNLLAGNPSGSTTPFLARFGIIGFGGAPVQGVTVTNNYLANATAAWHLENVRGITIRENVAFFSITREIAAGAGVVEGLSWQQMTRDAIGGQPASIIESTPTIYGMNTTTVPFANTLAESTLYSQLIPGKTILGSTNMAGGIRFQLHGGIQNLSGSPADYTFRFKYGGVTFSILRWLAVANSGGVYALLLRGHIFGSMGFPGNQSGGVEGSLGVTDSVKNTAIDGPPVLRHGSPYAGIAGADATVDQTFAITVQMSIAHANANVYKESAYLERLPY